MSYSNKVYILDHSIGLANNYCWARLKFRVVTENWIKNIFRKVDQITLAEIKMKVRGYFVTQGIGNKNTDISPPVVNYWQKLPPINKTLSKRACQNPQRIWKTLQKKTRQILKKNLNNFNRRAFITLILSQNVLSCYQIIANVYDSKNTRKRHTSCI